MYTYCYMFKKILLCEERTQLWKEGDKELIKGGSFYPENSMNKCRENTRKQFNLIGIGEEQGVLVVRKCSDKKETQMRVEYNKTMSKRGPVVTKIMVTGKEKVIGLVRVRAIGKIKIWGGT